MRRDKQEGGFGPAAEKEVDNAEGDGLGNPFGPDCRSNRVEEGEESVGLGHR